MFKISAYIPVPTLLFRLFVFLTDWIPVRVGPSCMLRLYVDLCDKPDGADPSHEPCPGDGGPPARGLRRLLLQSPLRRHVVLQHHKQASSKIDSELKRTSPL